MTNQDADGRGDRHHHGRAASPPSCRSCTAPRATTGSTSAICGRRPALVTLDNGYGNTGSCASAITYLDGDAGILRYRGYPIEQLAEKSTFLEVGYLLIYGELPTSVAARHLRRQHHAPLAHPRGDAPLLRQLPARTRTRWRSSSAGASALSTFYQDSHDPFNPDHVEISTHRLLAKMPTIAAWAYKKSIGQPYVYPRNELDYAANFLNMMFSVPAEPYEVDPVVAEALDLLLVLHADHEQNCSTSTVRMVGSSHANLFASISAGIDALWGPLHGGANQAAIEMLEQIAADGGDVAQVRRPAPRTRRTASG